MAGTHGIGVFGINSKFASGNLVFYEKAVGRTATGDVLTIGTATITVGGDAQDVDLKVYLGSATEYVLYDVGNSRVDYGEDSQGVDIRIFGDTASSLLLWDTSDDRLEFDGCDLNLQDSDILQFGDAQDVAITWNGTNLTINPVADNTGILLVGTDGTLGMDVKFSGATASAYMEWDNSADRLNIVTVSGRTIVGEEHAVDIVMGGTVDGAADSMVGLNVAVTPSGTLGTWASGIFAKVTQTVNSIDGYISAAEFEVNKSGAITNRDYGVIVLNNGNNIAGAQSSSAFILCREYGSNVLNALVKFGDNASYSASSSSAVAVSAAADGVATHKVRFITTIAGVATPMWFLATTTAPAGV